MKSTRMWLQIGVIEKTVGAVGGMLSPDLRVHDQTLGSINRHRVRPTPSPSPTNPDRNPHGGPSIHEPLRQHDLEQLPRM